jgi:hypothetical protein
MGLRGPRVIALDGLVFDVPDTPANDEVFGRGGNDPGQGALPQVRLIAVAECGTHALVDAILGPVATGPANLATQLTSIFDLNTAIRRFIDGWSTRGAPVMSIKTADKILTHTPAEKPRSHGTSVLFPA